MLNVRIVSEGNRWYRVELIESPVRNGYGAPSPKVMRWERHTALADARRAMRDWLQSLGLTARGAA